MIRSASALTPFFCATFAFLWQAQAREIAPDETFLKANQAFESQDYDEAISLYEQLVGESYAAGTLYLNLGTAHFRNGSPGRAALWFRRAAHLNPGMPEVRQNFEYLRTQLGILEFAGESWQRFLNRMPPALSRWCAWLCFWGFVFALGALIFGKRRRWKPLLIVTAVFAVVAAAGFFWLSHYRAEHLAPRNFATVVVGGTSALVAPAPDSAPVIALPEGSEVRVIEDTGPWLYAEIPGKLVGWVHHSSIEKTWPIPE